MVSSQHLNLQGIVDKSWQPEQAVGVQEALEMCCATRGVFVFIHAQTRW